MGKQASTALNVDGHELVITNPNKMLWPEMGITKVRFIQELIRLSPFLLPACRDRYLTTIRYPNGVDGHFFYQKNAPAPTPAFVHTAVQEGIEYVVLQHVPTLIWLGNLACIEYHPSLHRVHDPFPSEWIIDLDPSVQEEERIMEAAAIVGQLLQQLGIHSIPKTSGATGVQLVIPIKKGPSFTQLKELGLLLATYLCEQHPKLFTIERFKKNRGDRIYIDYMQHDAGRTIAAPYTPRATRYASVSMPLTWDEVNRNPKPREFNLLNAAERLQAIGDLIQQAVPQPIEAVLQALSAQMHTKQT
ncbi:non-homologous end-joining DNA ligase [Paenibacillus sp. MER TA 81-3]|uniref:non-homologous end-joining DNA ligase n=1 Tax=Paenibacillus sp. MER TA 81-3 TaxID=2939573 RepID=UPI0020412293|nr:non-homologous end-joining DNA ligase [Paenibacillus sp. MER TA 81-3]MCM3338285.1 non-homologous end-joining DNA ligase [Paenibacillus sp. MER TA 81-3]